jgi:hypothetical protein
VGNRIKVWHVFVLLLAFWVAWLYTEITEYYARDAFKIEVESFMYAGDRFTAEDAREMENLIIQLENHINDLEAHVKALETEDAIR